MTYLQNFSCDVFDFVLGQPEVGLNGHGGLDGRLYELNVFNQYLFDILCLFCQQQHLIVEVVKQLILHLHVFKVVSNAPKACEDLVYYLNNF